MVATIVRHHYAYIHHRDVQCTVPERLSASYYDYPVTRAKKTTQNLLLTMMQRSNSESRSISPEHAAVYRRDTRIPRGVVL
jgi:hypothetical protein